MTQREKTMQALVKKEAANLKKYATKDELGKLDFKSFSPASTYRCIYGQITGYCFSERAGNLIIQCAERVYENNGACFVHDFPVNGKPKGARGVSDSDSADYYSPIEVFILQLKNIVNGNNERLIKYLKGETKTLKFK